MTSNELEQALKDLEALVELRNTATSKEERERLQAKIDCIQLIVSTLAALSVKRFQ